MSIEVSALETTQSPSRPSRSRRGATTMEYLVMLSFLLLALILAVQGIGVVTGGMLKNSADATAKTNSP